MFLSERTSMRSDRHRQYKYKEEFLHRSLRPRLQFTGQRANWVLAKLFLFCAPLVQIPAAVRGIVQPNFLLAPQTPPLVRPPQFTSTDA
jgi:hypothetical protein